MSYEFYKILHQIGLFMIFLSLGAYLLNAIGNGVRQFPGRKLVMLTHGLGMIITLVAGFGLLARLGLISGWPIWVFLKLGIWFLIGSLIIFAMRRASLASALWIIALVLGGAGAYLARIKPF